MPGHAIAILVVDDEPAILRALARVLKLSGAEVLLAESAEDGLQLVATHRPALVISDYRMSGMDGLAFLTLVGDRLPVAKRVLYSASLPSRGQEAGITFLQKPCPNDVLRRLVGELLDAADDTEDGIKTPDPSGPGALRRRGDPT